MESTRCVQPIQHHIVTDFLLGAACSALTCKHKIRVEEIYEIHENHFRFLTILQIQRAPLAGTQAMNLDDSTCVD
jgi:hypothetical protein